MDVYRVLPEPVAEIEQIEPVAEVFLFTDCHQVIGKDADTGIPTTPKYNDSG